MKKFFPYAAISFLVGCTGNYVAPQMDQHSILKFPAGSSSMFSNRSYTFAVDEGKGCGTRYGVNIRGKKAEYKIPVARKIYISYYYKMRYRECLVVSSFTSEPDTKYLVMPAGDCRLPVMSSRDGELKPVKLERAYTRATSFQLCDDAGFFGL